MDELLTKQISNWLAQDPDDSTRQELEKLRDAAEHDGAALLELRDAFRAPLEFGTAGLRGKLGAGPNRMNRVVVIQAAAGLAQYLIDTGHHGKCVTIGFDARHNSEVFARDTAEVMAGAGFQPKMFPHVVPTPVLANSIRQLNACAGVMVTASHNPPQDNGYKVYLGDGRQIVPPADIEISVRIREVTDVRAVVRGTSVETLSDNIGQRYIETIAQLVLDGPVSQADRSSITSVYTAMHGVGWLALKGVFARAGFSEPVAVSEQRDPDPDFPTVAFPNPEEKGALDLAIELATETHADVLLANDPDADRLAIALPKPNGTWQALRGDQVGVLLAWWIIERTRLSGKPLQGTFANSIVSSLMLEPLAKSAGLNYAHTLTGFKWVSRVPDLIYGYEEALGYCVNPESVGDKDGISAAAYFMEFMAFLKSTNRTPWDILDELDSQFGVHTTEQISVRVTDLDQLATVMANVRANPPAEMGLLDVVGMEDLAVGTAELPATDGVVLHLKGIGDVVKGRVIIRPSGTEPKIKCYLEVVVRSSDLAIAREVATITLAGLAHDARPLLAGE